MTSRTTLLGFAERLIQARREAGLSDVQLSERTGIAYSTLRRRMRATPGQLTLEQLDTIANECGVDLGWLVLGNDFYRRAAA